MSGLASQDTKLLTGLLSTSNMVNKQTTTQGETTESRKHKGNVTIQKNEKSKKKYCTSNVLCNKVGVVGWVSIAWLVAYMNVCVSKRLKEELAWAIDKWLRVISNKMLFKTVVPLRN